MESPIEDKTKNARASFLDGPEQTFSALLITGASVSADWAATSPGKRLGWKYGGRESVVTVARGGTPGRQTILALNPSVVQDRSAIIALDFFFWDSTLASSAPSLDALQALVKLARDARIPLLLGDIPELLPGRQPARVALNRAIREACQPARGAFVMGLEEIHREVVGGGVMIHGRRHGLRDLVPDGLHLSEVAGDYLAEWVYAAFYAVRE